MRFFLSKTETTENLNDPPPPSSLLGSDTVGRSPATKKKNDSVAGEPRRLTQIDENEGGGDVTREATEATAGDNSESDGLFSNSDHSRSGVSHESVGEESGSKNLSKKEKKRLAKEMRDKANATAIVTADVTESNPPKKR